MSFENRHVHSSSSPNWNACVTVDETTLEGRGKTIEEAYKDAANRMIAHLQGKVVKPYESRKTLKEINWNNLKEINWNNYKTKHPCDRLSVL